MRGILVVALSKRPDRGYRADLGSRWRRRAWRTKPVAKDREAGTGVGTELWPIQPRNTET